MIETGREADATQELLFTRVDDVRGQSRVTCRRSFGEPRLSSRVGAARVRGVVALVRRAEPFGPLVGDTSLLRCHGGRLWLLCFVVRRRCGPRAPPKKRGAHRRSTRPNTVSDPLFRQPLA